MFKISINSSVLAALQAAFPDPKNTACRALNKYLQTLEQLLFDAVQFGRSPEQLKLDTFSISLQKLANLGGQIGLKRMRVHAWLRENNLELVRTVVEGSNLTGRVSDVKLTDLICLENQLVPDQDAIDMFSTDAELQQYLDGDTNQKIDQLIYPDRSVGDKEWNLSKYDPLEVDQDSLRSYIVWVSEKSNLMSVAEKEHALKQARIILAVSKSADGIYYQCKKPSEFGRIYYEGVSIQNVNKELRRAILGDCWGYDIRSSVIAWKMGFSQDYLDSIGESTELRKIFKATICYLEDKDDFMKTVRHFVFLNGEKIDRSFQTMLLKKAITAIGFGARATSVGWKDVGGQWQNPALVNILQNSEDRARFLGDSTIRKFIQEQNTLDSFIFSEFKKTAPELMSEKCLQTPSGRLSKSKVLAYCYQHSETQVMDIARTVVAQHGRNPLANIHDAIFLRHKLGIELKHEIELQMQEKTDNPYWKLSVDQLERYSSVSKDVIADELAHKARIQDEEANAARARDAGYVNSWSTD